MPDVRRLRQEQVLESDPNQSAAEVISPRRRLPRSPRERGDLAAEGRMKEARWLQRPMDGTTRRPS